jgi:uncharacterized protein DUF1153
MCRRTHPLATKTQDLFRPLFGRTFGTWIADWRRGRPRPTAPSASRPRMRRLMAELPPIGIRRWTVRRKAAVVAAVAACEITREEVCRRYQISEEEFFAWQRAYEAYGLPGLRSTRLQQYRRSWQGSRR